MGEIESEIFPYNDLLLIGYLQGYSLRKQLDSFPAQLSKNQSPPKIPLAEEIQMGFIDGQIETQINGYRLTLSAAEYKVLVQLSKHKGEPCKREQLVRYLGNPTSSALNAAIKRLRKQFGENDEDQKMIKTISGVGYMLVNKPLTTRVPNKKQDIDLLEDVITEQTSATTESLINFAEKIGFTKEEAKGLKLRRILSQISSKQIIVSKDQWDEYRTQLITDILSPVIHTAQKLNPQANIRRIMMDAVPEEKDDLVKLNDELLSVRLKNGEHIRLSVNEYRLISYLWAKKGTIVTYEEINRYFKFYEDSNSINVLVYKLREQIEEDPNNPLILKTLRNRGFMLDLRPIQTNQTTNKSTINLSIKDLLNIRTLCIDSITETVIEYAQNQGFDQYTVNTLRKLYLDELTTSLSIKDPGIKFIINELAKASTRIFDATYRSSSINQDPAEVQEQLEWIHSLTEQHKNIFLRRIIEEVAAHIAELYNKIHQQEDQPIDLRGQIKLLVEGIQYITTTMTSEQIEKRQHGLSSYTKDFKRSDGRVVSLTKRQYEYLNFFTTKPNQIVTAEEIINHVGEGKGKNDKWDGSVHAIVLSIRNKIEVDPRKPQILITYRGLGYKFVYPTEDKNLKQV